MDVGVFAGGIALLLWGIATPSLWRDEVVTAQIARGGWEEIRRVIAVTDLAHAPYYLLQWGWTSVAGHTEVALRLPSVLAMAGAGAMLCAIARQYTTPAVAAGVAVVFLAAPSVTRYGQEARSPALVVALVTAATLLLHTRSVRRWPAYSVAMSLAALFNVIAVLAVLPHAVLAWRAEVIRVWVRAALLPVVSGGAWALYLQAAGQRDEMLGWLESPTLWRLGELYVEVCRSGPYLLVLVVGWVMLARRRNRETVWLAAFAALPAAGWVVSQMMNVALGRYFLFVLPFLAMGAVLGWTRLVALYAAVAVAVSLPEQVAYRTPAGHLDDFRSAVAYLEDGARPGDGIKHDSWFTRSAYAYYGRRSLADPLDPAGEASAEVLLTGGTTCASPYPLQAFARVWFLRIDEARAQSVSPAHCDPALTLESTREFGGAVVELFVRSPAGSRQLASAAAR
ncbi:hypothetical protein E4P42_04180 [Mycobacterium sp. PS03-16]|uniref:hypothetical protein n=1 Tax=Mycobacterium sp. PS03-16 TaxID=2559611 RepID=UPI0010741FDE|nr:hypothetical protein [Mycobacterium sp. PS03-16]TFV60688.1 hypothetical protein E4P42_04180 [Mycobacterium sp. PS03-16]